MKNLALAIVALAAIIIWNSILIVPQWHQAIVFKFKEIDRDRVGLQPGLHFIIPVINTYKLYENRLLILDEEPERFLTTENEEVIVDFYVMWRIADVGNFYRATAGDTSEAERLLKQRAFGALRDVFGTRTVQEVVVDERGQMMEEVQRRFIGTAEQSGIEEELGIEIVDIRTIRVDLPDKLRNNVFDRMRAERSRVAKDYRARGAEEAEKIRASAEKEREQILAEAYRNAETIRGKGDADATKIYADAFGKDYEFYDFYRSLNAYRNSFQGGDMLVLSPDDEFFKYFRSIDGATGDER